MLACAACRAAGKAAFYCDRQCKARDSTRHRAACGSTSRAMPLPKKWQAGPSEPAYFDEESSDVECESGEEDEEDEEVGVGR